MLKILVSTEEHSRVLGAIISQVEFGWCQLILLNLCVPVELALSIWVIVLIKAFFDLAAKTHVALVQKIFDNKLALR